MNTVWVVGAILVLVVLVGGVWYATQQPTVEQPVPINDQQAESLPTALVESPTPVAQVPVVETAVLVAVGTYKGSGTATRSFDSTTFVHAVTASISDPAAGKFYEGWLVMKTASGPKFFSTGKLTKQGAQYTLSYTTATQNYPDHNDVVITEETLSQGLDGKPEAHVLEGSFQ